MKTILLIIPFIILLVPVVAIYGELSISEGLAKSLGMTIKHDRDDYYFETGVSSADIFRIHKIFYADDDWGRTIRFTYDVPSWSYNIEKWYEQRLISYGEQQRAFDYIVYSDIAEPRY